MGGGSDGVLVDKIGNYKHVAAVQYKETGSNEVEVCTATIMTAFKIMTAAHCVFERKSVNLIVGSTNLDDPYQTVNVSSQEIICHPEFSIAEPYENDLAVIQLKKMLKFDGKIGQKDSVNKGYKPTQGQSVTILGYSNKKLRLIESTIHDMVACRYSYLELNKDDPWLDDAKQCCVSLANTNGIYAGGWYKSMLDFTEQI